MVDETQILTAPDTGKVTVVGWAQFDPGAFNETDQLAQYIITNVSDLSQFSTPPQITTTGDLIFGMSATATSSVTFDVFVRDTGGTDNGGEDTSDTLTVELLLDNDLIFRNGFEE